MLHSMLKNHKKTALLAGNGFSVDCILKEKGATTGFQLKGFSTFVGANFDEKGIGYFGDSFEITIDVEDVLEHTNITPAEGWLISVSHPEFKNSSSDFYIQNVAIDRTLGLYLLKCSASTGSGQGKRVNRNNPGGI